MLAPIFKVYVVMYNKKIISESNPIKDIDELLSMDI